MKTKQFLEVPLGKMKQIIYSIVIVLTISVVACTRPLEYKGEQTEPLPTLYSINEVGDSLSCLYTKSRFFLDTTRFTYLRGATVQYRVNGGEWVDFEREEPIYLDDEFGYYDAKVCDFKYGSDYVIKPDDVVEIQAMHHSLGTVRAEQTAPRSIKAEISEICMENGGGVAKVTIYPQQGVVHKGMRYRVEMQSTTGYADEEELVNAWITYVGFYCYHPIYGTNTDIALDLDAEANYHDYLDIPVEDVKEPLVLELEIPGDDYYTSMILKEAECHVTVSLWQEEYYLFRQSSEHNSANSPFSEKYQVYSNIEGGVGNFSINSTVEVTKKVVEE